MTLSVHTNAGALTALQNLNQTNRDLNMVQNRVNTGFRVTGAKDNAAIYAIAQNMRADIGALNAVDQSLNRAISISDVALAAGEAISDILVQMKEKVLAANDSSLDQVSRNAYNEDFVALRNQINTIIENAIFDGANLIDGSVASIEVLADAEAQNVITVTSEDLSLSGTIMSITTTMSLTTLTAASSALTALESSITNVNAALARIGSTGKTLETHEVFVGKLQDTLETGVGNLVDADLATESARLQALQVQQQLGVQALSIANQQPQLILSLFGG
ncbi:MAG: flagellin [Pseudomonadota bacterium]